MKHRILFLACAALAVSLTFGITACSDDDGPGPQLTGDAGTAQSVLSDVLFPTIEALNLAQIVNSLKPMLDSDFTDVHCTTLDICDSGTAEACVTTLGTVVTFTDCVSHSTTVNGTVSFGGSTTSGTASINVALNDLLVIGTISYFVEENCFTMNYSVSVSQEGLSATMDGDLLYCDPPLTVDGIIVPHGGNLTFNVSSEDRNIQFWFYESETPGAWSLSVYDGEFIEELLFCTGFLFNTIECGPPIPVGDN